MINSNISRIFEGTHFLLYRWHSGGQRERSGFRRGRWRGTSLEDGDHRGSGAQNRHAGHQTLPACRHAWRSGSLLIWLTWMHKSNVVWKWSDVRSIWYHSVHLCRILRWRTQCYYRICCLLFTRQRLHGLQLHHGESLSVRLSHTHNIHKQHRFIYRTVQKLVHLKNGLMAVIICRSVSVGNMNESIEIE